MGTVSKKTSRFMALEGVRGVAALVVVLHHFVFAFYYQMNNGDFSAVHMKLPFEQNIYGTPLDIVYAGTFAVAIFFVLSGFVLSIGYFQTKDENIVKKLASSRYVRLMLPALASVLLAYMSIKVGFSLLAYDANQYIQGKSAISEAWQFEPHILGALWNGVGGIFLGDRGHYNTVLWTMYTEFWGSFMVFAFLMLFAKSKYRWIAYLLLSVFTFNSWFMAFVIGMVVADIYTLGWLEKLKNAKVTSILLVGAIFFGGYPHKRVSGTIYKSLDALLPFSHVSHKMFFLTLGATMLILAVLLSSRLSGWFSKISILGKYTFSLYLTHKLVLFTFTSAMFISLHRVTSYNKAVVLAALLSIPVMWAVTLLFERYIDAPSIELARRVGAIYRGEKKIEMKKIKHLSFMRYFSKVPE